MVQPLQKCVHLSYSAAAVLRFYSEKWKLVQLIHGSYVVNGQKLETMSCVGDG